MARIAWSNLVKMLREHPDYPPMELGVSAEQALIIVFGPSDELPPGADVLEVVDGHELVLRKARAGKVTSIEVV